MKNFKNFIKEKNNGNFKEDMGMAGSSTPTVNIGSGEIAGGGYKGIEDVKVSKKAASKYKKRNKKESTGRKIL